MTRFVFTVVFAIAVAGCSATRGMSRSGAPPNPACCSAIVTAGDELLASWRPPEGLVSYDTAENAWHDIRPERQPVGELISVGDRAALIAPNEALIYEPRTGRWTRIAGPGFQWLRLVVQGSYVIAVASEGSHGSTPGGSAVLDLATLRWHRVPEGPPPRRAPYFMLGDVLVVMPGVGTCPWTPCRDPRVVNGSSEAWVAQPAAAWRVGEDAWRPIEGGPLAFYERDPIAAAGDDVIGRAESAVYFVVEGTELREVRTGPRSWWRLSANALRFEPLEGPMVELDAGLTLTTRRHALFATRKNGVVLYDANTNGFVPPPAGLTPRARGYILPTNDGRALLLDGERLPKEVVDFEKGTLTDVRDHGLPRIDQGRRWFVLDAWTGHCVIRWGETTSEGPTAVEQCRDAPANQGCDPVSVPVDYTTRGYVWCLPR